MKIFVKRGLIVLLLVVSVAGVAWAGHGYWARWRFLQATDDAYIEADYTIIAPKVQGYVAEVLVSDNETVKAGQVLARIDDRDFRTALAQATADVATAAADIRSIEARLHQQRAGNVRTRGRRHPQHRGAARPAACGDRSSRGRRRPGPGRADLRATGCRALRQSHEVRRGHGAAATGAAGCIARTRGSAPARRRRTRHRRTTGARAPIDPGQGSDRAPALPGDPAAGYAQSRLHDHYLGSRRFDRRPLASGRRIRPGRHPAHG